LKLLLEQGNTKLRVLTRGGKLALEEALGPQGAAAESVDWSRLEPIDGGLQDDEALGANLNS
jgi:hypothetical protein